MRRCVWIFLLCLVVSVPVLAQDTTGYPLPDSLQPITPENAGQLRPLASIGGDLMGEMAWSPDGKWLAVGTTGGVRVYDTADSRMLPRQYPGDRDVDFDSQGNLVSAGRVTDVVRGITTEGVPETGPSSRLTVVRREEDGEAVVLLTDRATGQETTLRTGLTGTVNAVVFSPDEQKVVIQVSVRQDQAGRPAMFLPAAQLWDVTESRLIAPLELNSSFDSFDIRFYAQGQRLVIASSLEINYEGPYALLQIWDVPTGQILVTDETPISWIRISPDDRLLAYPAWDGVALWSDHEIGTLGNGAVLFPIFSPDGHWLAGYRPEGVFLWTIDPARLPGAPDKTLTECCIDNVVFSPDSARLAIYEHGINGYQTRLWSVEAEATEIATSSMGVPLQFSPDSRWILAKQQDSEIYALWDARTGERRIEFNQPFVIDPAWTRAAVRISPAAVDMIALPGGEAIQILRVIEDYRGETSLLDADAGRVLIGQTAFSIDDGQILSEHWSSSPPPDYAVSADWERIVETDRSAPFRDVVAETRSGNWVYERGSADSLMPGVFLTPDGALVGQIIDTDQYLHTSRLEFRSVETGNLVVEWSLPGSVETITFSHDKGLLALGVSNRDSGWMVFIDLSGDLLETVPVMHPVDSYSFCQGGNTVMLSLVFSHDDRRLAASWDCQIGGDGLAHFYYVQDWDMALLLAEPGLGERFSHTIYGVYNPVFSADGRLLLVNAVHGFNGVLDVGQPQLWDAATHQKLATLPGDAVAAFSPDGQLLAVHDSGGVYLYAVATLKQGDTAPIMRLEDANRPVLQVAFNGDGTRLYIRSENRLWVYGVAAK